MKSWIAAFMAGTVTAYMSCASVVFAATPAPKVESGVIETSAQQAGGGSLNAKPDAGGIAPCIFNCYIGPRVGPEYNEGRGIATMEWLQLVPGLSAIIRIVFGLQAYGGKTMSEFAKETGIDSRPIPAPKGNAASKGGITACLVTCYFGPRIAFERNEGRKMRSKEIWLVIPILNIVAAILMGLEAYQGKTMTQIARDEGLDG